MKIWKKIIERWQVLSAALGILLSVILFFIFLFPGICFWGSKAFSNYFGEEVYLKLGSIERREYFAFEGQNLYERFKNSINVDDGVEGAICDGKLCFYGNIIAASQDAYNTEKVILEKIKVIAGAKIRIQNSQMVLRDGILENSKVLHYDDDSAFYIQNLFIDDSSGIYLKLNRDICSIS